MRRNLFPFIPLLLILGSLATSVPAEEKLRVAVILFSDRIGDRESTTTITELTTVEAEVGTKGDLGGQVADAIITDLVKLGRYEVVERIELQKVVDEQKLQQPEMSDLSQLVEAANVVDADLIIMGSITQAATAKTSAGYVFVTKKILQGRVVLDTRLIDVKTSKALWGTTTEGHCTLKSKKILGFGKTDIAGVQFLLGKAARQAADMLVDQLVPELEKYYGGLEDGPVFEIAARLRENQIYLAAGFEIGVQEGDKFDLYVLGEPFKVGEKTIQERIMVGSMLITEVQPDYAVGTAPKRLHGMPRVRLASLTARRRPYPMSPDGRKGMMQEAEIEPHYRYITKNGSRVRVGPGVRHEVLTVLPRETVVKVVDAVGDWLKVRTISGTDGWIYFALTSEGV